MPGDDFDIDAVGVFEAGPIETLYEDIIKSSPQLARRMQSSDSKLVKKQDWSGSLGRVECTDKELAKRKLGEFTMDHLGEDGYEGWLFSLKYLWKRLDTNAYPVPMVPCLISPCSAGVLYLIAFHVEHVLSEGISLNDYAKYLDTPSGVETCAKNAKVLRLREGQVAYLPLGWLALTLNAHPDNEEHHWIHAMHIACFNTTLLKQADKRLQLAMRNYNESFLVAESVLQPQWKPRCEAFKKYFQDTAAA